MPLVGGGGSPNVAGSSNPSGTGTGLNHIGNHAYAYSGLIGIDDSGATMLDFSTGSSYVNAVFDYGNSTTSGDDIQFKINLNGETIMVTHTRGPVNSGNAGLQPNLILPPFSRIQITGTNFGSSTERLCVVAIVGRVYA
jgi:hypothetical protein